ncbi:cytochrome P450 [Actinomycetospora sp. NBRC 106378]|uniref:cytochrome P450 n=1 Tax=Actinomycetospora sp. NBRC 106378 TaxID=3032208 RepID=UPI0024A353FE|nr:cytochrome P450 [Actinomycetospora sp. NBRC 106378]GLZ54124.1 putative cytochrome P450 140 [Actinomycetospora sp. NBRC 106378]
MVAFLVDGARDGLPSTPALAVRWGLSHGLLRRALAARDRAGNRDARLLRDPALQAEPWEHYRELRRHRPFASGPMGRVTAHHDITTQVLRSDDFGVADRDQVFPAPVRLGMRLIGPRRYASIDDAPSMLAVDPPDHARYRRLVTRAFTAKAVAALRTRTEEITAELLDGLEAEMHRGPVDLVERFAAQVPVTVIAEMLGVPPERRDDLLVWGDGGAATLDLGLPWSRYATAERSLAAFDGWLREHLRTLRSHPGDDLLSKLVTVADDDGSGLSEQELVATSMLILAAGFETTVNLISNGTQRLFEHPDQRALLAEQPDLWSNAVDEVLRHDSPVQRTARLARRDTEVEGVPIRRGEIVVTVLGAANRDPAVFTDPERFDVTRPNAREHVAFSSGIHYCLGAALARMEGEVALRGLFDRFPDLAPAGVGQRRPTIILRGWRSLPVHS